MTDPQNDIPCRDCKRPTQHATEICDDCRTPAGLLVTALEAAGIEGLNHDSGTTVGVGCLTIEMSEDDSGRWTIDGFDADGVTAVDAIAAIVQAPGLRADVDARVADAVAAERHAIGAWLAARDQGNIAIAIEYGDHIDDDAPPQPSLRMVLLLRDELLRQVETLTAERDRALARVGADALAEVER